MLIHLHIPKNGGTTLSRIVKAHLLRWPPSRWLHPLTVLGCSHIHRAEPRIAHIRALTPRRRSRIAFFEAHRGYGTHETLGVDGRDVTCFTMLREPVARAISVYNALIRDEIITPEESSYGDLFTQAGIERAHPDSAPWVWWIDNAQVRYLAGESGKIIDVPPGNMTRAHLDMAIARIEHDIAITGLLERFDESVLLLLHHLGWRGGRYVRSNIAREKPVLPDEAEKALIAEHNALDTALYEHAASMFEERIKGLGDVDARLAAYRQRNARYSAIAGPVYRTIPGVRRGVFRIMRTLRGSRGGHPLRDE